MLLTAILFSRYRAFLGHTRFEVAPLTVVIGKNGAGKSVLTRLPLLLASGLSSQAEGPLDLEAGEVTHGARFEDLINQRSALPFSLGAEISVEGRRLKFITTLQLVVERHSLGVAKFELYEDEHAVVKLEARPEDIGNLAGKFVGEFGAPKEPQEVRVRLAGLFPTEIEGQPEISARLKSARDSFEKCISRPSYIGPFRSEQGSLNRIPRQSVRRSDEEVDIDED